MSEININARISSNKELTSSKSKDLHKIKYSRSTLNTFRVLIDKGILLHPLTMTYDQIADHKVHYKSTGTDCSGKRVGTDMRLFVLQGYLVMKRGSFRKPNTFMITTLGSLFANSLIQKALQYVQGPSIKKNKYIKNSSCKRERVQVKKEIKQFKRINLYAAILMQVQKALQITTRGMANYLQFDDNALYAVLKEKDLHGKDKTRQAKEFCRLHMLERGLFPDIDIVYRTWRKIDQENNGIRMPLFCMQQTIADVKHVLKIGVHWIFKKGTAFLADSDPFSPRYKKEKKDSAQRKENYSFVLGSIKTEEQKELYISSCSWKVKKTDARSQRLVLMCS
jgi:hypothetical protein